MIVEIPDLKTMKLGEVIEAYNKYGIQIMITRVPNGYVHTVISTQGLYSDDPSLSAHPSTHTSSIFCES